MSIHTFPIGVKTLLSISSIYCGCSFAHDERKGSEITERDALASSNRFNSQRREEMAKFIKLYTLNEQDGEKVKNDITYFDS